MYARRISVELGRTGCDGRLPFFAAPADLSVAFGRAVDFIGFLAILADGFAFREDAAALGFALTALFAFGLVLDFAFA